MSLTKDELWAVMNDGAPKRDCSTCAFEYPMSKWETGCNRQEKRKNPCDNRRQHWVISKDWLWKTMKSDIS